MLFRSLNPYSGSNVTMIRLIATARNFRAVNLNFGINDRLYIIHRRLPKAAVFGEQNLIYDFSSQLLLIMIKSSCLCLGQQIAAL